MCLSRVEYAFLHAVRFSSSARLLSLIPEDLQKVHRSECTFPASKATGKAPVQRSSLWDGWADALPSVAAAVAGDEDGDELDLSGMGL